MKKNVLSSAMLIGLALFASPHFASAQSVVGTNMNLLPGERQWLIDEYGYTEDELNSIIYFNRSGTSEYYFVRLNPSSGLNTPIWRSGGYFSGVATGNNAVAGRNSLSVGESATSGNYSTAMGNFAYADNNATAIGYGSFSQGLMSSAFGISSFAGNDGATALGAHSYATGNGSTAVGDTATATGNSAVAIGRSATAAGMNCVAIGQSSECLDTEANTVSVGTSSMRRRIINVADGVNSSDAVNMSQLNSVVGALGAGAGFNWAGFVAPRYEFISGNVYNNVADGLYDLDSRVYALEQGGTGSGTSGPAGPAGADGQSAYEIAVNNGYIGTQTEWLASLKGKDGVDGKDGLDATGGSGTTGPQGQKGDKGDMGLAGADGKSAYEVAQGNGYTGTEVEWLASLKGQDGKDGVGSNITAGDNIEVTDNADGSKTVALKDTVNLGNTTVSSDGVRVANGASVTTNGVDAGNQRVTGVANGRIERGSTDAVNGGQVYQMQQEFNDRWTEVNNRIDRVEKRFDDRMNAMGAKSAAMAMMASASSGLEVGAAEFTAGLGFQSNKSAMAIGYRIRATERTTFSAGLAFGSGSPVSGGIGVAIQLGR